MKELVVRALSGAVYVALVIGAALAGDVAVAVLFLPICAIGAWELSRLLERDEDRTTLHGVPVLAASIMYLSHVASYFRPTWSTGYLLGTAALLIVIDTVRVLRSGTTDPGRGLGSTLLALLLGSSFASVIAYFAFDTWLFIGFMLLLWTNDTGAYLVGRSMGRTKLMPAISPKKTVEGFLGGVALTVGIGLLLGHWHTVLTSAEWGICATGVALTATIGDLFESALKRARGVKDSGRIMPGHGGILDRFDGFLLAAPTMLIIVMLLRGH